MRGPATLNGYYESREAGPQVAFLKVEPALPDLQNPHRRMFSYKHCREQLLGFSGMADRC
jgi:hypothetical protein